MFSAQLQQSQSRNKARTNIMSIIREISFEYSRNSSFEYIPSMFLAAIKNWKLFCRHSTHVFRLFPKKNLQVISTSIQRDATQYTHCCMHVFHTKKKSILILYLVIVFSENLFCSTIYTSLKLYNLK